MGSYLSCHSPGKIVLPNGNVRELDRSVSVAELMLDHPQHFVVEFRPSSISKLLPLPADYKLDPNKVYLMIPMARGNKSVGLSIEDARRAVLSSRSLKNIPLVGLCMTGTRERVTEEEEVVEGTIFDEEEKAQLQTAELLCRQYSNKGWKPSLGTIQERNFEKKMPHWLF